MVVDAGNKGKSGLTEVPLLDEAMDVVVKAY